MPEREQRIVPGGDELLRHVAFVSGLQYLAHDRWVIDLLGVVQFGASGIPGGVVMPDEFMVLPDAPDHVAIHDRHMVDVEKQLEMLRADLFHEIEAEIDIVAEVTGMALHGVGVVAGVEVLKHEGDAFFLGERQHFFPAAQAVLDGFFAVHALEFHAGEGDDFCRAELSRGIDGFFQRGDGKIVVLRIAGAFGEAVAADERDLEAEFFDFGIEIGADALHGDETDLFAVFGERGHIKVVFETPAHDGLADVAIANAEAGIDGGAGRLGLCCAYQAAGSEGGERGGGRLEKAAAGGSG